MEHAGEAETRAEVLRVGPDGKQSLGGGLEQEVVDDGLVLIGDVANVGGHGEHDVEVRHRQEFSLARIA